MNWYQRLLNSLNQLSITVEIQLWYLFMSFRRKTWKYVPMVLSVITVAPSTVKNVDYWTIPSVTELYPCLSSMLISFSIYLVCNAKILDVHEIISRWNSLNTLFSSWQNATTNILVTIIIMDFVIRILFLKYLWKLVG